MSIDPKDFTDGDRVRAVFFALDEGLRIWPVEPAANPPVWRVVEVADQEVKRELVRGDPRECERAYPEATFGINDNESVPPGTEGTVDHVSSSQVGVRWDNGRRLFCAPSDQIEKL
jgi:hypothetical protein